MPLSQTLKEATAEAHRRAESRELQRNLIRGTVDPQCLAQYLAELHRIHGELERLFDQHEDVAIKIGWCDDYRHSRRLQHDLALLNVEADDVETLPIERLFESINSLVAEHPMALLGFMYVLEGSMNGNRFIARALRKSPAASGYPVAYFDPYGDEQPARWAAFKVALDNATCDSHLERIIVNAALCLFEAISEICESAMAMSSGEGAVLTKSTA